MLHYVQRAMLEPELRSRMSLLAQAVVAGLRRLQSTAVLARGKEVVLGADIVTVEPLQAHRRLGTSGLAWSRWAKATLATAGPVTMTTDGFSGYETWNRSSRSKEKGEIRIDRQRDNDLAAWSLRIKSCAIGHEGRHIRNKGLTGNCIMICGLPILKYVHLDRIMGNFVALPTFGTREFWGWYRIDSFALCNDYIYVTVTEASFIIDLIFN